IRCRDERFQLLTADLDTIARLGGDESLSLRCLRHGPTPSSLRLPQSTAHDNVLLHMQQKVAAALTRPSHVNSAESGGPGLEPFCGLIPWLRRSPVWRAATSSNSLSATSSGLACGAQFNQSNLNCRRNQV